MNQYYLLSQLPALERYDGKGEPPITEEAFLDVCTRFLSKGSMDALRALSLTPPRLAKPTGSALADAWDREERSLRLALATVRAAKLGKSFPLDGETIPAPAMQAAQNAMELDPLSAEESLNRYRLSVLERIRPADSFSEDAVLCYALRLKLLTRMHQFDAERGRAAYQKIYHSILDGNSQEN